MKSFKILKSILLTLGLIVTAVISSCITEEIGPPGPQGPQGPVGPQGAPGESGYVFEYENVNFTGPDYEVFLEHPDDFEGLDSDVTLVYFLWDVQSDGNGDPLDIWRALPQTILHDNGTLIYNFDHSKFDVRLFLRADFDLNTLTAIDTDDWIVRVVIIPANFWNRSSVDFSDYNAVKEAYGLPDLGNHESVMSRMQ